MAKRKAAAVSMDPLMFDEAKARAHSLGFSTFSAYIVQLVRQDLRERGAVIVHEDAHPSDPPTSINSKSASQVSG